MKYTNSPNSNCKLKLKMTCCWCLGQHIVQRVELPGIPVIRCRGVDFLYPVRNIVDISLPAPLYGRVIHTGPWSAVATRGQGSHPTMSRTEDKRGTHAWARRCNLSSTSSSSNSRRQFICLRFCYLVVGVQHECWFKVLIVSELLTERETPL